MPLDVESDIATALFDHLKATAGIWPISWPNRNFSPPKSGRYVRADLQPNETDAPFLSDGPYLFEGLMQVTVVERPNAGAIQVTRKAAKIARQFDYLTELTTPSGTLQITQYPTVSGGIQTDASYEVPVTIRYRMFAD